jgi:hypothetical protein
LALYNALSLKNWICEYPSVYIHEKGSNYLACISDTCYFAIGESRTMTTIPTPKAASSEKSIVGWRIIHSFAAKETTKALNYGNSIYREKNL